MNVAVIGASSKEDRYAFKAHKLLKEHGHHVFPVGLKDERILGDVVYRSIKDITEPIDTVTLYVGPAHLAKLIEEIISVSPKRVIFNPGTEDAALIDSVQSTGIEALEACTLVLLSTGQF